MKSIAHVALISALVIAGNAATAAAQLRFHRCIAGPLHCKFGCIAGHRVQLCTNRAANCSVYATEKMLGEPC